jgi:hypothetical protein
VKKLHIKDNIKNFLYDQQYFINVYDNYIHLFNYEKIDLFSKDKIIFTFANFRLIIKGKDFYICKMLKKEILIKCNLLEISFEKK